MSRLARYASVAELADAQGLGPCVLWTCGFDSLRSQCLKAANHRIIQDIKYSIIFYFFEHIAVLYGIINIHGVYPFISQEYVPTKLSERFSFYGLY